MSDLRTELDRRATRTQAVLDYFLARPYVWVDVRTLAEIGGFAAWRTRISEARQIVHERRSGDLEWNGKARESAYRYVPLALPQSKEIQLQMEFADDVQGA